MKVVEAEAASPEEVRKAVESALRSGATRLILRVRARDPASAAELVRHAMSDTLPFTVVVEVVG